MDNIELIRLEIRIKYPSFVSVNNFARIIGLTEQAVFEIEQQELQLLRQEFREIPDHIFDAVILRLYRKAGSSVLVTDARNGSIILAGAAVGLAYWLLNKTLGETVKEAWVESDLHQRIKKLLLSRMSKKKQAIGESIQKKLSANGIETGVETTDESVTAYVSPQEDEELSSELHQKPVIYRSG